MKQKIIITIMKQKIIIITIMKQKKNNEKNNTLTKKWF